MKTSYTEEINILLALCHIFDNFKNFEQNLIKELSPRKNRAFIIELYKASQGEKEISERAEKFYNENKKVLDTINKYCSMYLFINFNYNDSGKPEEKIQYLYNYLNNNKDNINSIINLLEKLKELGFQLITIDEQIDFSKNIYTIYKTFEKNKKIPYLANLEVLPTYTDDIQYQTNNSNYLMELSIINSSEKFSNQTIILNSLLFDIHSLPEVIDKEHIFNPLLKRKNEQFKTTALIKNSVNLNTSIEDLEQQLNETKNLINNLENIESIEELLNILKIISLEIKKLKTIGINYNQKIIKEEELLTAEILEKEKTQYQKKRKLEK